MAFPEFDLNLCKPGQMDMPTLLGGGGESQVNLAGQSQSIDIAGGGAWTIKYSNIQLRNTGPDWLRYWSWLCGYLNGGVRSILVPMMTDFYAPRDAAGNIFYTGITHDDGTLFDDGTGYSQSATPATILQAAAEGASLVNIQVAAGTLVGGEIFEITYPTTSRVYEVINVVSGSTDTNGISTYFVNVLPPLRKAVPAGTNARFNRPRCQMKLKPGYKLSASIDRYWRARPEIEFIESFGNM